MERLKVAILHLKISIQAYLHSSMERLKGIAAYSYAISHVDLHSSMERLKVEEHLPRRRLGKKFTFQYGEIKSQVFPA